MNETTPNHQLLDELYRRSDAATAAFATASGLACPPGCGICCTRFVPDVSTVEAERIERYLTERGREVPRTIGPPPTATQAVVVDPADATAPLIPCPFYSESDHCTIYPVRPLVCRLFAFAGGRNKQGESTFTLCREMPAPPHAPGRTYRGRALRSLAPVDPPEMQMFGRELEGMCAPDGAGTTPIDEAVEAARERAKLRERLGSTTLTPPDRDSDDDTDPPSPEPRRLRPAA